LGGHNFFDPISFLTIFCAPYAPIGGIQVLFRHKKQQNPPSDLTCLKRLSVQSLAGLPYVVVIKKQLEYLTHMPCF
jgi:hypothetical protein